MVQQLIKQGLINDAYRELKPMVERANRYGFHEWWSRDNQPQGSGQFRGSAGVLGRAIELLEQWAAAKSGHVLEPKFASPGEVAADALRLEAQVLAESEAGIERNRKGDVVVRILDTNGQPIPHARVTVEQTRHEFLFGCNIYGFDQFKTAAENEKYKRRFAELFNYATVGFYWRWYEPEEGKPQYAHTDRVIDWCREHRIRMKGHPLLWADEAGIPTWSPGQPRPERQKQRVFEIMQRYQGRIESWEVVNEPSHLPELKIDSPYRWAREADPKAVLIVNDYHIMADGQPAFYGLLERADQHGVPFDGIGIQAHEPRTMRFPLARVKRVLDHYGGLGKGLHITEFTPTSAGQPMTGSPSHGSWDEAAQAAYATQFYRVCFAHPSVVAITWWDLCDAHSWLKGGGMLRADLTPKPVYEALRDLTHTQWHTRAEGATDDTGRFAFRGFFGDYEIRVLNPRRSTGAFHFSKNGPKDMEVRCQGGLE
jgi:GH35 family endo-1,4-beta-xylanase